MDELMIFSDWIVQHSEFFDAFDIDEVTKEELIDWFYYRRVCDNVKFERFFKRKLQMILDQYKAQLRIQTTEFDPMVSNYVEHWVLHTTEGTSKDTKSSTSTGKGTAKNTGSSNSTETPEITRKKTGSNTSKTVGTTGGTDTETPNLTNEINRSGSDTQTNVHTENLTETPNINVETTSNSEGDATTNLVTDRSGTVNETGKEGVTNSSENSRKDKSLAGVLPDSSTYGMGLGGNAGDMPGLDWTYAAQQNQSQGLDTSSGKSDTERSNDTTNHETGKDDTTSHNESNSTTNSLTTGNKTTERSLNENDERTTTGKETQKQTGTKTTEHQGTSNSDITDTIDESEVETGTRTVEGQNSGSSESTNESTSKDESSAENSSKDEMKEISTGRAEAPQDMLERARNFIRTTNALKWLISQLDTCFLGTYDVL